MPLSWKKNCVPFSSVLLVLPWLAAPAEADLVVPRLVSKTLYVPSPLSGCGGLGKTFYTQGQGPQGQNMMSIMANDHGRSDNYQNWQQRYSER